LNHFQIKKLKLTCVIQKGVLGTGIRILPRTLSDSCQGFNCGYRKVSQQ